MAGFWRVCPSQSQDNARNVGSDRTLSERCLTNVDSDPRSLPAPELGLPPTSGWPPRSSQARRGTGGTAAAVSRQPPAPCLVPVLSSAKARAAEGRRAAASWMELAQYRTGPRCPSLCVPGWDRSVGRGGTHRRRVRDTTAEQPAAQTTGGGGYKAAC